MGAAQDYLEQVLGEYAPDTEEEAVDILIQSHMRQQEIIQNSELPDETRHLLIMEKLESMDPKTREFIGMILGMD